MSADSHARDDCDSKNEIKEQGPAARGPVSAAGIAQVESAAPAGAETSVTRPPVPAGLISLCVVAGERQRSVDPSPDAEDKNAAFRDTRADVVFSDSRCPAIRVLAQIMSALLMFSCLRAETALSADAPKPPSQKSVIQEVVRVANEFIDHGVCEPTRAEPSSVATMSPYTPSVEAGRTAAEFVVIWAGDMGCRGGSGANTMNYLLVEKRGVISAHIVGLGELGGASVERIVATTPDSLTVDGYTWGPNDPHCCASAYERWTFSREPSAQTGSYTLRKIDSKAAEPFPLRPGEKKLPTANLDY